MGELEASNRVSFSGRGVTVGKGCIRKWHGVTRTCGEVGIVINLHERFCLVPSFLSRFQSLPHLLSSHLRMTPFHSNLPHPHPHAKYSQALSPSGGSVVTATHTSSSPFPPTRSSRFQPDNFTYKHLPSICTHMASLSALESP